MLFPNNYQGDMIKIRMRQSLFSGEDEASDFSGRRTVTRKMIVILEKKEKVIESR